MAHCLIGLGSNLGDRCATIEASLRTLGEHPELRVLAVSGLYETRPVGGKGTQPAFLNAAARIDTAIGPAALLNLLQRTEDRLGRLRRQRWDARTVDLDLLLYGDLVLETRELVLPHPRMAFRRFVLEPAVEIAAEMIHPPTGWSLRELLQHLQSAPNYIALVGISGVGKTRLARTVARLADCRLVTASLPPSRLAAFHADSSGRAWETQLEFLGLRCRRLNRRGLTQVGGRGAISDFWLDQTLVYGRHWLPEAACRDFQQRWSEVKSQSPQPKLLVFVDVGQPSVPESRAGHLAEAQERLRAALLQQASLPRQAPLLKVDVSDFNWAVQEVTAAHQAMQDPAQRARNRPEL